MDRRRFLLVVAVVVALLGAGLVFVYAQNAEDRAARVSGTTEVLVAKKRIPAGTTIEEAGEDGALGTEYVPNEIVDEAYLVNTDSLTGMIAASTIYTGDQILEERFVDDPKLVEGITTLPVPAGQVAISVNLDDERKVGAFVRPGTRVDIYVTLLDNSAEIPKAQVLLDDVYVIAVGSAVRNESPGVDADGNPLPAVPVTNLSVAVSNADALTLVGARDASLPLSLGLRTEESTSDVSSDTDEDEG